MKGNSQTAVYLSCTKNRTFQRKHVEVCKRCKTNTSCKPYQEYIQTIPTENAVESLTDIDRSQLLRHIIKELQEIKKLTLTGTMAPANPFRKKKRGISKQKLRIGDIRTAIKEIQLLCKQSKF
jgi:hypothetical protein